MADKRAEMNVSTHLLANARPVALAQIKFLLFSALFRNIKISTLWFFY